MSDLLRNGGITGMVDHLNEGVGSIVGYNATYQFDVYGFNLAKAGQVRNRYGRNQGEWGSQRTLRPGGTLLLRARQDLKDWPEPPNLTNQVGSIRITFQHNDEANIHKGCDVPVLIRDVQYDRDLNTNQYCNVILTAVITAEPVSFGFDGVQPVNTNPTPTDVELYEGTTKVKDPNDLETSAERTYDLWGNLADTDADELSRITAAISAQAGNLPMPYMKVRNAVFNRTDTYGAQIKVSHGLNDTADDVIFGQEIGTFKAEDGNSYSRAYIISDRVSGPGDQSALRGLAYLAGGDAWFDTSTVRRLNPLKMLAVDRFITPPYQIRGEQGKGRHLYRCIKDGEDEGGNPIYKVFVASLIALDDTTYRYEALLIEQSKLSVRFPFSIETRINRSNPMPTYPDNMSTVNDATFLGLAKYKVQYQTCDPNINIALASPRTYAIRWNFMYDSLGFVNDSDIPDGWHVFESKDLSDKIAAGLTIPGWVDVKLLKLSATAPTTSNFTSLFNPPE